MICPQIDAGAYPTCRMSARPIAVDPAVSISKPVTFLPQASSLKPQASSLKPQDSSLKTPPDPADQVQYQNSE